MASPKQKRKPKPKKSASDKAQSEAFKATARLLGADQTGVGFERAFSAIAPPKRASKSARKVKTPAKAD
jgi:hypothetical protein